MGSLCPSNVEFVPPETYTISLLGEDSASFRTAVCLVFLTRTWCPSRADFPCVFYFQAALKSTSLRLSFFGKLGYDESASQTEDGYNPRRTTSKVSWGKTVKYNPSIGPEANVLHST